MKFVQVIALVSAVAAQGQPTTTEFPDDCQSSASACSGSKCCSFSYTDDQGNSNKLKRCVTSA